MVLLEQFKKHLLSVLVRNVTHHYRRATVWLHIVQVDHVGTWLLIANCSSVADCWSLHHVVIVFLRHHLHHHLLHGDSHVGRSGPRVRSESCRDGIRTVFRIFSNHPHAGVHDCSHRLIFFLAWLFGSFRRVRFTLWLDFFFTLILQQKYAVIKSRFAVGCDFFPIFSWNSELCEWTLFVVRGRGCE